MVFKNSNWVEGIWSANNKGTKWVRKRDADLWNSQRKLLYTVAVCLKEGLRFSPPWEDTLPYMPIWWTQLWNVRKCVVSSGADLHCLGDLTNNTSQIWTGSVQRHNRLCCFFLFVTILNDRKMLRFVPAHKYVCVCGCGHKFQVLRCSNVNVRVYSLCLVRLWLCVIQCCAWILCAHHTMAHI